MLVHLEMDKILESFSLTREIVSIIIWLNWSRAKRSVLIGSLSGPNFATRTAKMDRLRSDFTELRS